MPLSNLSSYDIILGSGSPRRKELLASLQLEFRVIKGDVEEIIPDDMAAHAAPVYLSELKADDLIKSMPDNYLLITSDTIVIHEGDILGKPTDRDDAIAMVTRLAGTTHEVITGVTVRTAEKSVSFSDSTSVALESMTPEEVVWYIDNCEVMDKAGSYGVQDWIGVSKITKLEGSYYNVMGLPTHKLYEVLREW